VPLVSTAAGSALPTLIVTFAAALATRGLRAGNAGAVQAS